MGLPLFDAIALVRFDFGQRTVYSCGIPFAPRGDGVEESAVYARVQ
jgi:hypothetical protein